MRPARRKSIWPLVLAALLATGAVAMAQTPPAEDRVEPCDPAEEPCEELISDPETAAAPDTGDEFGEIGGGPAATVEEDMAIEASADEEFTPGDEISEDYPIPLPADI